MERRDFENPNSEKNDQIREKRQRPIAQGGAVSVEKEKLYIVLTMVSFALVLLAVVLAISFCSKDSDGGGNLDGDGSLNGGGEDASSGEGEGGDTDSHQHDYALELLPNNGSFTLIGHCSKEGCPSPDVVKHDVQGITVSEVPATCIAEGKKIYSCHEFGKDVVYEEPIAKGDHVINGKSIDSYRNPAGYLVYDGVNITVIKSSSGAVELACDSVTESEYAGYTCSACHTFYKAPIYVPHVKDSDSNWKVIEAATCTKEGTEALCCKFCKTHEMERRTVSKLDHSFKEELKYDYSGSKIMFTTSCLTCDYKLEQDVTADAEQTHYKSGTCGTREETTYSYVKDEKTFKCSKLGDYSDDNHVHHDITPNEDGTYDYVKGVTVPMGDHVIECGKSGEEGFTLRCASCGEIYEWIKVNVPNHVYAVEQIVKMPTFEEKGEVNLKCSHSWCSKTIMGYELDKLLVGEGGNSTQIEAANDVHGGKYEYTFVAPGGTTIKIEVTLSKSGEDD